MRMRYILHFTYLLTLAATTAPSDYVPQLCGWHTALWLLSSFRGWRTHQLRVCYHRRRFSMATSQPTAKPCQDGNNVVHISASSASSTN